MQPTDAKPWTPAEQEAESQKVVETMKAWAAARAAAEGRQVQSSDYSAAVGVMLQAGYLLMLAACDGKDKLAMVRYGQRLRSTAKSTDKLGRRIG